MPAVRHRIQYQPGNARRFAIVSLPDGQEGVLRLPARLRTLRATHCVSRAANTRSSRTRFAPVYEQHVREHKRHIDLRAARSRSIHDLPAGL